VIVNRIQQAADKIVIKKEICRSNMKDTDLKKETGKKFVKRLLHWNERENKRQMPWKGEKDPYKIWLSEIILQQTRVEQGWNYYKRFIQAFPTVQHLAAAPEQQVYKLWEGLGYYTRCKNLIVSANYISNELAGVFPSDYQSILRLKGVGGYTAAAIASFAFNLPYAVLDGNVFRVLSRIMDIETPIDSTEGKKIFSLIAQTILPLKKGGEYNQAIMDFGATICKPQPECAHCFFTKHCKAFLMNKQALLPVKSKKTKIKERFFNYIILKCKEEYAIRQRSGKDIWQNLYEFLLMETEKRVPQKKLLAGLEKSHGLTASNVLSFLLLKEAAQKLSHQTIYFSFYVMDVKDKYANESFIWIKKTSFSIYPFPKTLLEFIKKEFLTVQQKLPF
jgi:A/G-specific adenine glycosylase